MNTSITPYPQGHRLPVRDVVDETVDSRSLVLEVPHDLREVFDYRPGQFLTFRIPSQGDRPVMARCYSLASTPGDDTLKVNVKRVVDGVGSNWICDHVAVGDEVEVLPPAGRFTPSSLDQNVLLFAGGSGITPIISIARAVLEQGTGSVVLVYANRDAESVIYAKALSDMVPLNRDRFTLVHHLESEQGLPTEDSVAQYARLAPEDTTAFICGPEGFMKTVEAGLKTAGFARNRVVVERFASLAGNPFAYDGNANPASGDVKGASTALTVEIDGIVHELAWPANSTLLDVLLDRGIDAPFSCREGACSACTCQVLAGAVTMETNEVLEDEDLEEGLILACQARSSTAAVHITYG